MKEKFLFVVNPVSGKKNKGSLSGLIEKKLNARQIDFEIIETRFPGDATSRVRDYYTKGFKIFIAVGGDGTVNEVASAIVDTDAVLGIIPVGSGNGLARHLKIPMNPRKALNLIFKRNILKMDYGKINDRLFFCTTGVGFDAHVGHVFSKTEGRGFANYIKASFSEFVKYEPQRYEIATKEKTLFRDAFLITCANASQYGNNAHIAPKADVNDGKMEVAIMRAFPIINAPVMGARLFLKNIDKSQYLETFSCEELTIRRKQPDVIHFDGEPGEMGEELRIKIIPKGLNVFVD
ncbi:MAG: hypothetical protein A2X13_05160 [Bacteroidetes bacterium GWC2_33_15]|nr:MAG: hypothetical protein A2X10_11805 [Bacteroidetes bacterium GWA2_33_15]OFX51857.1 MAG: hypothetical protein A2X13_05160 [Bacteroidetes bacterium GWC2_33_15]OFX63425.1 MAG: hypothetical protein A2X15_01435 [Bacteroidetes bacterium GWB2_32_14]OFX67227.1 MAG: hypothetical protein A2X14_01315 [Bacteroidetes bacterium GWD2_33_33]HAN17046.1 hypothetical protein [Bacteroidales bacterium]